MILDKYLSIVVIYHPLIEYVISVSNIQHSMLVLRKENTVLIYKGLQENTANRYFSIFGNLNNFNHCRL